MRLKQVILRNFIVVNAAIALLFYAACGSENKLSREEEGIIEFDTRAVDESHPLYGFAPSNATLKFKGEKFVIEMSTMGMFNMAIIGDIKTKTLVQTIKFMNIKQACVEKEKELEADNQNYRLNITETNETKEIAGLKCHKLEVTKVDDPNSKFDAWYTKELGMENCNALTPYADVKGVLMDYRIKKMGIEMHFLAKSYQHVEIKDQEFEVPASMKIVTPEEMAKFFQDLQ